MIGVELREPVAALTHGLGCALAAAGTVGLWRRGGPGPGHRRAGLAFGLSLVGCLGLSALYHGAWGPESRLLLLRRLDHVGIYALIAGTYTPIAWALMGGPARRLTLASAWLAAAAGSAYVLAVGGLPPALATLIYLAFGWGALGMCLDIARRHPRGLEPVRPVLVGGVLYSVGALIHLADCPAPWPGVVGAHEVFHLFVLAGAAVHYALVARLVAPRPAAVPAGWRLEGGVAGGRHPGMPHPAPSPGRVTTAG